MKCIKFLLMTSFVFALFSCNNDDKVSSTNEEKAQSELLASRTTDTTVVSPPVQLPEIPEEIIEFPPHVEGSLPEIFNGDDILWFNISTKELRFKHDFSRKDIQSVLGRTNIFYIDDTPLFSTVITASSILSYSIDRPVLYYDVFKNKFYLTDGYPTGDYYAQQYPEHQAVRDENWAKIKAEWDKFIEYLSNVGKIVN